MSVQRTVYPNRYSWGWFDWFCLWYPPGWLILFNRHWQYYHDDPQGWNGLEYFLFLLPGGFYLALFLRWLRLGFRWPTNSDRQIDPNYQTAFREEILLPILKIYFRAELHQLENLPQTGSLIVALNHAGMCFPWDIIGLATLLGQVRGWVTQPLAHELFFDHPWLRWWLPAKWLEVLGGVRAVTADFETAIQALDEQKILLYAPEGWRGLAKGWKRRYHLQTFDPSFIQLSQRYQVPILPVVCLGNESLHPWTINVKKMGQWLGLPIFPLSPLLIAFLFFPSMGVWANRTQLRYYLYPLEQPWEDETLKSISQARRSIFYQKAQKLRSHLQSFIDQLYFKVGC